MSSSTGFLREFDATVLEQGVISISNRLDEGINQNDISMIGKALCTFAYISQEIPIELSKKYALASKITRAEKLVRSWQQSLAVGSTADVYDAQYDAFYAGKITSRTGNNISIHFLGWKGFDLDVDITETPIYPMHTITVAKRKPGDKSSSSSSLLSPSVEEDSSEQKVVEEETAVDAEKPTIITTSGRCVKLKIAPVAEVKPVRDPNKKKETILELDGRECNTDDNEFLCFECGYLEHPELSEMVLCDGPCLRTAHYACLNPVDKKRFDTLVREYIYVTYLLMFGDVPFHVSILLNFTPF